jgi:alpha-tubulin suppressor-like RCC1 family protein
MGQLGLGDTDHRISPCLLSFPTEDRVVAVYAHGLCSFAITENGSLYAWGDNGCGQLALGHTDKMFKPTRVKNLPGTFVELSCGYNHVVGLTKEGVVYAWGSNDTCKLAQPEDTVMRSTHPLAVPMPPDLPGDICHVYAGSGASFALLTNGTLYSWGWNAYGNLGNGKTSSGKTPKILFKTGVRAVACGWAHAIALMEDGSIKTWGHNDCSQLGILPSVQNTFRPMTIDLFRSMNVTSLICGCNFAAVIVDSGELYFSGRVGQYQQAQWGKYTDLTYETPKVHFYEWRKIFRWMFEAKADPLSPFHDLPVEVIFSGVQAYFKKVNYL